MATKIYIITDMEGVSGISREDETTPPTSPRYQAARKLLCADINAAIEGAFEGGADEVIVNDGHGGGGNLLLEEMDSRAVYERPESALNVMPGLDGTFSGLFCVGYHAMAGTLDAFLDHTQDPQRWLNYYINGRRCGELAQMAAWAGSFGVPVLLVTGDRAACLEANEFFPGALTVPVKDGLGRQAARCLQPAVARKHIAAGARDAMELIGKLAPFRMAEPVTIRLECQQTDTADILAGRDGTRRVDGRTVERVVSSAREILDF